MVLLSRPLLLLLVAIVGVDAWKLPFISKNPSRPDSNRSRQLPQTGVATMPETGQKRTRFMNFVKDKLGRRDPRGNERPVTFEELEVQHVQVLRDLDTLQREREVFLKDRQLQADQLKTWSSSVKELKSQVASLEKELSATRKEIQAVQSAKRKLELSLADAQNLLKSKNPVDASMIQTNNKLMKELEQERRTVEVLKGREAALIKEREGLQTKMESVLADITKQFESEKKALEARIASMQEKQAAVLRLEKEMGAKQEAWERNNQGLQVLLEKQRVRYAETFVALEAEAKSLRSKLQGFEELQSRYEEVQQALQRSLSVVGTLDTKVDTLQVERDSLAAALETAKGTCDAAQTELMTLRIEADKAKQYAAEAKTNYESAEAEATQAKRQLEEERETHMARVLELRYEVSAAARQARAVKDEYAAITASQVAHVQEADETVRLCLKAVMHLQEVMGALQPEYDAVMLKVQNGETAKLKELADLHNVRLQETRDAYTDAMQEIVASHNKKIKQLEKAQVFHIQQVETMYKNQIETREKKFTKEVDAKVAQIQSLELAVQDEKKRFEEEVSKLQLSFEGERGRWETEKEQIFARGVAERTELEEKAKELDEKLKAASKRLKHFEDIIKDPWQLFLEAIHKTFNPSDSELYA